MVDLLWAGNLLGVPRTIWKGALSFGLVNIPVGLYPATSDKSIHFNQFEEGTSDRIRYKKVNERTGEEVPQDRIVRGFDLGGGEYVILSEEELESRRAEEVAPDRDLRLRRAWPTSTRSSSARATTWPPRATGPTRPTPCCARPWPTPGGSPSPPWSCGTRSTSSPSGPRTTRWPSTPCTSPTRCAHPDRDLELPETGDVTDRELSMAQLLIESMESDWDPERFHDTHREKVEALIEEKRSGHEIVLQDGPEARGQGGRPDGGAQRQHRRGGRPGSEAKSAKRQAGGQAGAGQAAPPRPRRRRRRPSSRPGPRPPPAARPPERRRRRAGHGRTRSLASHIVASSTAHTRMESVSESDLIRFPAPKRRIMV